MPVQKEDGAPPIVARHRAAPVRVAARDAAGIGGIVAWVVEDPAARLFRGGIGHTLEWVLSVDWLAAGIGYVGDCGWAGSSGSTYARPLGVRPGSKIAAADAEVHSVIRDPEISGARGIHLDELIELPAADRTKQEIRALLIG